jgi:hypothetical protein
MDLGIYHTWQHMFCLLYLFFFVDLILFFGTTLDLAGGFDFDLILIFIFLGWNAGHRILQMVDRVTLS